MNINPLKKRRIYYIFFSFIFAFLLNLYFPNQVNAYLDPGTGSYMFQLLIAGLIGGAFAIKMTWRRIKGFFIERFSKGSRKEEDES
jgi:hypothetical protein